MLRCAAADLDVDSFRHVAKSVYSPSGICLTVPYAVIKITGISGSVALIRASRSRPPSSGMRISLTTRNGDFSSNSFKADLPLEDAQEAREIYMTT